MFGAFFVFILACMFWKWVLLIVGSIAALVLVGWLIRVITTDLREQAELDQLRLEHKEAYDEYMTAKADRQRNWFEQGDPRAIYGEGYVDGEDERR